MVSQAPASDDDSVVTDVLPSSLPRERRGELVHGGTPYAPCFCVNCGARGPMVAAGPQNFAAWLCDPCAEKWSPMFGLMLVPDEVHWELQRQEQVEKYGRALSPGELAEVEKDGNNTLVKLAKDWKR